MRSTGMLFFLGLSLAGCTGSSGMVDVLSLRPSQEVTNSIAKPDPPPAAAPSRTEEAANARVAAAHPHPLRDALKPVAEAVALVAPASPGAALAAVARISPQKFRDAKPINFGKVKPKHYAVHGVDVSRWQGEIDWARLRGQGANFAYIKATDGGDHLDPMFAKNWKGAHEAGLKRGAYHFFYWCRTAGEQAEWFIRNVPKVEGALPPVIDVEYNGESRCRMRLSKARVVEKMQVFMDRLEAHYGQRPVIYTAPDFYADNLRGEFPNHPFWLRAVAQHPSKVYPGRKWLFWQYSGSGLSHGVEGRIDLNAFHGSEAEWAQWNSGQKAVAQAAD